jgi:hypothetical protein
MMFVNLEPQRARSKTGLRFSAISTSYFSVLAVSSVVEDLELALVLEPRLKLDQ